MIDEIAKLEAQILQARNESLSYYNTNSAAIHIETLRAIEANQIILKRSVVEKLNTNKLALKVIFLLPDISLWDVYAPIYKRMSESDQFEPFVLAFERYDISADKTHEDALNFFANHRLKGEYISKQDGIYPSLENYCPDIVFYTLGTVAYPPAYRIEFVSRFCLTCYLSYGFLMVNELDYQFGQSFHHAAWKLFASTERERVEYAKRSKRITPNIELVGYPKFDLYGQNDVVKQKKPKVIWAPHWTIGLIYPALNLGTFDRICNSMLEYIASLPEVDFVFRPHPNLKYACEATTFMHRDSYEFYLSQLSALENVTLSDGSDNIALFKNSSGMITDSVSFLAEYLPSGRPLLFLNRPDRQKFSVTGENIVNAHYHGLEMVDIKLFVENQIIAQKDPKSASRKMVQESEIGAIIDGVSERIINTILESFEP